MKFLRAPVPSHPSSEAQKHFPPRNQRSPGRPPLKAKFYGHPHADTSSGAAATARLRPTPTWAGGSEERGRTLRLWLPVGTSGRAEWDLHTPAKPWFSHAAGPETERALSGHAASSPTHCASSVRPPRCLPASTEHPRHQKAPEQAFHNVSLSPKAT